MVATRTSLEELMNQYGVPSSGKSLSGHFNALEALELMQAANERDRTVSQIIVAATKITSEKLNHVKIGKAMLALREPDAEKPNPTAQQKRQLEQLKISIKGKTLTGHFSPKDAVEQLQQLDRIRELFDERFSISEYLVAMTFNGLPTLREMMPALQSV